MPEPSDRRVLADGGPAAGLPRSSAGVLADRLAAALVHHEPGWRLPRQTALARRYNVSMAEIDAAVGELAARHLVRRLPDGQLYRASPAEYLIPLEGLSGLASHIDPMGGQIACRSRQVSWRRVPEDIGWALGVPTGGLACVIRLLWTADGEPAAVATTYLARHLAGEPPARNDEAPDVPQAALAVLPLFAVPGPAGRTAPAGVPDPAGRAASAVPGPVGRAAPATDPGPGPGAGAAVGCSTGPPDTAPGEAAEDGSGEAKHAPPCVPSALFVELQPPSAAVARSLRLSAGQPAAMVTVRFDDPVADQPAAVTVAVLRPDLFRIVIESPASALPQVSAGSFSGAWTTAMQDWEP